MGIWGVIPASLLGTASPLCMYGTIPIAASFSRQGMRDDWLAAFMMSSILLNPQLMLYSTALGSTAFAVRLISCIICGIVAGVLVHIFFRGKAFFRFDGFAPGESHDTDPNMFLRFLKNLGRNVKATGIYFLAGVFLSALFQRYVPAEAFASLFGESNEGFGLLLAATIGVPLYACGGGTIPLLQQWLASIKKNPFGERFLDDHACRTILTTLPTFLINVAYTVYNGVIGIMNQSVWFITMAVYYSLLGIMRYRAVNTGRKISHMEDRQLIRKKELSVIKTDGILLLVLNLALSSVVLLTIAQDTAKRYSEIMVISIAAYTFYKITMALINMIKVRKTRSPILITIRNIEVADALVSVLTLQATMLASFQNKSSLNRNQMNAITGLAVCILIAILGVSMIRYAFVQRKDCDKSTKHLPFIF